MGCFFVYANIYFKSYANVLQVKSKRLRNLKWQIQWFWYFVMIKFIWRLALSNNERFLYRMKLLPSLKK